MNRLRKPSLRWVLIVPFVVQIVGFVGLTGYLAWRNGQQAVSELANRLMDQTTDRVRDQLKTSLNIQQQAVGINYSRAQQGQLNLNDREELRQYLWQQITLAPSLSTTIFANAQGQEVGYVRILSQELLNHASRLAGEPLPLETLILSETSPTDPGQRLYSLVDQQGKARKLFYRFAIDNRTTDWYRAGKASQKPTWSPVFVYRVLPTLGVSAVAALRSSTGQLQGMFMSSIDLAAISTFLSQLKFSPTGQAFIVDRAGNLVATSTLETPFVKRSGQQPIRLAATQSQDQQTRTLARHLQQHYPDLNQIQSTQHLRVVADQKAWFTQVTPYQDAYGLDWLVVTLIPESDFTAQINANTQTTWLLCGLALVVATGVGWLTSHWIAQPIQRLSRASLSLSEGNWQQSFIEDCPIAEIAVLAHAFNYSAQQLQDSLDRVKTALETSEAKFRKIFDACPDPISLHTLGEGGIYLEVNESFLRFSEYSREELIGHAPSELGIVVDENQIAGMYGVLQTQGRVDCFEFSYGTKSGRTGTALISLEIIKLEGQSVVLAVAKEISDRKQLEQELQHSKERLQTVLDNSFSAIGTARVNLDRSWNLEYLSIGHERLLGLTVDELKADLSLWFHRIHPEDLQNLIQPQFEKMIQGPPATYEYRFYHPAGEWRWISATLSSRWEVKTQSWLVTYMATDITKRRQIEAQLQSQESFLRSIYEGVEQAIFVVDVTEQGEFRFVSFNPAYQRLIDFPCEKLYGKTPEEAQIPDWEAVTQRYQDCVAARKADTYEEAVVFNGQETFWYTTLTPLSDSHDRIYRLIGTTLNITSLKQAEAALYRSEFRLHHLASVSPAVIYSVIENLDGPTQFDYLSPAAAELHEIPIHEILENPTLIFEQIHPDDREGYQQAITQSLEKMQSFHHEWRIITPSGKVKWLQANSRPERQEDGSLIWHGIAMEISDRKQVECELQQAKEAAEAANLAKSVFLANMSHELRTPLNAILGFTQIMYRDPELPAKYQEYVKITYQSGELLLKLINEVLDLSKIEAGKLNLDIQELDLFEMLHSLRSTFIQRAANKGLQLHLKIAPEVPQYILADSQKLQQVLINLISNALKFTKDGYVTLSVTRSLVASELPGNCCSLVFQVSDTGSGIAAQDWQRIFDAFTQASEGLKVSEGTGLGLTISQKLVRAMGGEITVNSRVGQGSTFQFTLSFSIVLGSSLSNQPSIQRVTGLLPGQPDYRILVVDDQLENRLLLAKLLEPLGLEVQAVANGEAALLQWQQWQPHLIWMDMRMPGLSGLEVTQQIRAQESGQSVVIIALTAQASLDDRALILTAGCDDYISKPFQVETLLTKLAEHLGLRYTFAEESWVSPDLSPLTLEQLAVMPQEWVVQLHKAVITCEQKTVQRLIKQIPSEHSALALGLSNLCRDFAFQHILKLTQAYLES